MLEELERAKISAELGDDSRDCLVRACGSSAAKFRSELCLSICDYLHVALLVSGHLRDNVLHELIECQCIGRDGRELTVSQGSFELGELTMNRRESVDHLRRQLNGESRRGVRLRGRHRIVPTAVGTNYRCEGQTRGEREGEEAEYFDFHNIDLDCSLWEKLMTVSRAVSMAVDRGFGFSWRGD